MRSLVTADAVAGPTPDQDDLAHEIAIDGDTVQHAIDFGYGRVLRHHSRVHALLDAAFGPERYAQKLDAIAEIVGRLDIGGGDRLDPLDVDRLEARARAEG
jgi:hypothetical protein